MLQCELLCVPTGGSGFCQWVWILPVGLDFASGSAFVSGSGYENPMSQTPCFIMWSTNNHGIIWHSYPHYWHTRDKGILTILPTCRHISEKGILIIIPTCWHARGFWHTPTHMLAYHGILTHSNSHVGMPGILTHSNSHVGIPGGSDKHSNPNVSKQLSISLTIIVYLLHNYNFICTILCISIFKISFTISKIRHRISFKHCILITWSHHSVFWFVTHMLMDFSWSK